MPRPKRLPVSDPGKVKELCLRHSIDPFEEMIKMYRERIPIPVGYDKEALAQMLYRFDIVKGEDGKDWLQPTVKERTELMKECAQYVYPKLRSSETKEEKDFKVTVLIQSFDGKQEPKRVGIIDVVPQLNNGNSTPS